MDVEVCIDSLAISRKNPFQEQNYRSIRAFTCARFPPPFVTKVSYSSAQLTSRNITLHSNETVETEEREHSVLALLHGTIDHINNKFPREN